MKDAKCCKDEIKIVKNSNDNFLFSTIKYQNNFKYEFVPKFQETYIFDIDSIDASLTLPSYHAPPNDISLDFQSLYCHFRI